MRTASNQQLGRFGPAAALLLACGLAAGCDWSLGFESGSLDIVEELLCPECDDTPKNPDAEGNSPGTSGGGGSSAPDESTPEDDEPEVNAGSERSSAIVAGRRWVVEGLHAEVTADHEGRAVVAVVARASVSGVDGEATIFVPSQLWPVSDDGSPVLFVIGEGRAAAQQNPSMTLGGKDYLLEFVATSARVDETPAGPRIRGAVDAHAVSLSQAGKPDAKKQLVRLSFDADAE